MIHLDRDQTIRVEVHKSGPELVNLDQVPDGPFGSGPSVSFRIQNRDLFLIMEMFFYFAIEHLAQMIWVDF